MTSANIIFKETFVFPKKKQTDSNSLIFPCQHIFSERNKIIKKIKVQQQVSKEYSESLSKLQSKQKTTNTSQLSQKITEINQQNTCFDNEVE